MLYSISVLIYFKYIIVIVCNLVVGILELSLSKTIDEMTEMRFLSNLD